MYRHRKKQGFTLIELLITLGIFGIVMGIAAMNLRPLQGNLQNSAVNLSGHMKKVRARAMASTSAYRVVYVSPSELRAEVSNRCSADASTWQAAPRFGFTLEQPITLQNGLNAGDALLCFSSRGFADASPTFTLQDDKGKTRQVVTYRGGAVELR